LRSIEKKRGQATREKYGKSREKWKGGCKPYARNGCLGTEDKVGHEFQSRSLSEGKRMKCRADFTGVEHTASRRNREHLKM